jgi:hypothetical protein
MRILVGVLGFVLIFVILWEAFESIVLPRRVTRKFRLTRFFYRGSWFPWAAIARRKRSDKAREAYLSFYGPLSLLFLFAVWALALVIGFSMIHWMIGQSLDGSGATSFGTDVYVSGTTFFTLGLGDVVPHSTAARALTVIEGGTGFGFLALVIGYLPVLYQAFSRREVNISLLDSRAGSPFSAVELLRRHGEGENIPALIELLKDWEHWSADLMESHLSYPVLSYFRSQHDNQSWVGALTAMLDACALVMTGVEGIPIWQARLTFAMARHAVVDLSQIFGTAPEPSAVSRLPEHEFDRMNEILNSAGLSFMDRGAAYDRLARMRGLYEPYVSSLARFLLMPLPHWLPTKKTLDNWQKSAWERSPLVAAVPGAGHAVGPSED